MYNGYVKELDDDTKRKNEIKSVVEHLITDPENKYYQNWFTRLVYGNEWEAQADQLRNLAELNFDFSDAPHPVDEVKTQFQCENCVSGVVHTFIKGMMIDMTCKCCDGEWQDCPNCKPVEYADSYRRFVEANKPKEDAVDYGI